MAKKADPKTKVYAVLTGDIVGSTKLSPGQMAQVRATVVKSVRAFALRRYNETWPAPEFFQGDSWQLPIETASWALQTAVLIQANLLAEHGVWTRTAIGIGTAEGLEKTAALSTGEVFTLSGHALENIPAASRLTGALPERTGVVGLWFPRMLHMCSNLMRGWTRRQAEVMGLWLNLPIPTYDRIATELTPPIAMQTVGEILASANLPGLREAFAMFHATPWQDLVGSIERRAAS